jgi:hypothetical protein
MPVVELDSDVLERLEENVGEFAGGFGYITRTRWAGIYGPQIGAQTADGAALLNERSIAQDSQQ